MLLQTVIQKKRDKQTLARDEIESFIKGVTQGHASEGQIAAFCMAVLLNNMTVDERVVLTQAMAQSGQTLDWSDLDGIPVDKHSSGGVGDKVTLIAAPIVAACGGVVPKLSGRGLGHTGGTCDKLESIPGYNITPDMDTFRKVVHDVGCAVVGATQDLAPADKKIYAVRDVTATVESIDLIAASIMSKKLAAGAGALVLDVKTGSGAFMPDENETRAMAQAMVEIGNGAGLPTVAVLTDMNQVLGRHAGNALEISEVIDFLKGDAQDPRLLEVVSALSTEMLVLSRVARDTDEGHEKVRHALESGQAAEKFSAMVAALGGPKDALNIPFPAAPIVREYKPKNRGVILSMNVQDIGMGIVALGGGRRMPTDQVDHRVGLSEMAGIGEQAHCVIHAKTEEDWAMMSDVLDKAMTVGSGQPETPETIKGRII